MGRPARALLDPQALRHNLGVVRRCAPEARAMAVVKANAYGHGLLWAAETLAAADGFAVASTEEALPLREAGTATPICLLEGFFSADEILLVARHNLEPVIHDSRQIDMLEAARLSAPLTVWLKADTGMHRLGFPPEEFARAWRRLKACPAVARVRVMSHLANADDRGDDTSRAQIDAFSRLTQELGAERSLANSAGVLAWPDSHLDWVRPGIMLYGASPLRGASAAELDLRPVMTLASAVIAVHNLRKGDRVGYGGDWCCPEDMPVGVVAIGYGDGYPRHAPDGTPVLVNGQRVPLVGRVSMDMITVDLRRQPRARVGDAVVLWGEGLPVDEVATMAGTISYELLCQVTGRVPRMVIGRES